MARCGIAQTVDQAHEQGVSLRRIAGVLGRSKRTLRHWRQNNRASSVPCRPRGRPVLSCSAEVRNQVIRFLHHVTGPAISMASLRALFPKVARCILEHLLKRYRRVWRRRYCPFGKRLRWHQAGTVWAMDFSESPCPIDGQPSWIFAVRDLASGYPLVWQAVAGQRAEDAIELLVPVFQRHGAPLVLKSDNGSAFLAEAMRAILDQYGVVPLFSPVGRPAYNGALERSNRTNKIHTGRQAARAGRPEGWRSEDLEAAREQAGAIQRPWGHRGATSAEAWEARPAITEALRGEFLRQLDEQRRVSAEQLGMDASAELDHRHRSRLDRHAIGTVLQRLGLLSFRRGDRRAGRPTQVTGQALAKRAARHGKPEGEPAPPAADELSLPPVLGHRPCVDPARDLAAAAPRPPGTRRAVEADALETRNDLPRLEPDDSLAAEKKMVAAALDGDRMKAPWEPAAEEVRGDGAPPPARREPALTSWWRSPITLLVSLARAATITR